MFNSIRSVFLCTCLFVTMPCISTWAGEEKKADVNLKAATAETIPDQKSVEVEVNIKNATNDSSAKTSDQSTQNEVESIEIDNHGIQAIFINSKVTINGSTISTEMSNIEGAAAAKPSGKPGAPSRPGGGARPGAGKKPKKPGMFDKLIKDATKSVGLFTVYTRKDEKIYWEIDPEQLDQNYLASGVLATGLGAGWIKPGSYMGGIVVYFRKIDEKLQFVQRNLRFVAPPNSTEKKAISKNFSDAIIASFPIEATNPESSAYVIEMGKFFLTDLFNLGRDINSELRGSFGFDRGNSYVKETKVFPENVVVRTLFAFRSGGFGGGITVPSPGSAQVELLVDIRRLKDNPAFKPRLADTRIGHFLEAHIDFSEDERSTNFVRYISRWDIRKASPDEELSPPVKPVVMWIENTVPKKYRKSVKRGLLEWNKAFEKIGIQNAIVVKEQPDDADWDAADARYNTIHWNESQDSAYAGVAQWVADPRTGEILHGSFLIEGESLRSLFNLRRYREPDRVQMVKDHLMPKRPKHPMRARCDYQYQKTDQAVLGMTILAARAGIDKVSPEVMDEFVDEYIFSLVAHEFGHVLGFRHNFEGSTLLPLDDLHNKEITAASSISSSIMDYSPVNIAPEGVKQGHYFEPTIGPYDYLAVEYAYKQIKPATGEREQDVLNAIAEKAETPRYSYGTDEDLYGGLGPGIDPLCNQFDLSNDPLGYGKQVTQLIEDTIPKIPKLVKEGDTYVMVRNAYNRLLGYYFDTAQFALKYIGGQYVNRVKKGGINDRSPLEPVSTVKQREAVNFLVEKIFSDELFDVDPDLLNMLAAEKWYHWGTSWPGPSSEYSLSTVVQNLYDSILYSIYSPVTIRRILDGENQRKHEEIKFTVPELFRKLKQGIWSEVYQSIERDQNGDAHVTLDGPYSSNKPFISTFRRILQRQHLKRMIEITLEPPFGMPEDARTQAWRTLVDLEKQLSIMAEQVNFEEEMDAYSRDHLAETLEKIHRALDAQISKRVDIW